MPIVRDRNLKKLRRMKQKARLKLKTKMMSARQTEGIYTRVAALCYYVR